MKYLKYIFISALFVTGFCGTAAGEDLGEILYVFSPTHSYHKPSQVTQIEVSWEVPEGDRPYGYYVQFDTTPYYRFDQANTLNMMPVPGTVFVSPDYGKSQPDSVSYYFHIAAAGMEDDIGPTGNFGPFLIDIVPPRNMRIAIPETATSRSITLNFEAADASEMYLSNYGYGEAGEWEPFRSSKQWQITRGPGEKTVYVRFRDTAKNTDGISAVTRLVPGDADGSGSFDIRDALAVLQILSGKAPEKTNRDADANADRKIGIAEAVFVLRKIAE